MYVLLWCTFIHYILMSNPKNFLNLFYCNSLENKMICILVLAKKTDLKSEIFVEKKAKPGYYIWGSN